MDSPALSFGPAAQLYDAVRPTYPAQAVEWAVGGAPLRVLDLGAGTGRLTQVLLTAGHDVVCVDPDPQMLAVLSARIPQAAALHGCAEDIPLPDGAVDAVVCGQAYHWFDRRTALPEITRVLTPGGVFAPLWNLRDESVPWVHALSAVIGSEGADLRATEGTGQYGPWFTGTEHAVFDHSATMGPDALVDLVRSRSYYLTADEAGRAQVERAVRDLAATHPDLAGRAAFAMPYETHVYRSRRV